MKIIFIFLTLIISANTFGGKKVLVKDKLVFKVVNEIFSLSDLVEYKRQFDLFKCFYGQEALIIQAFSNDFKFDPGLYSPEKFTRVEKQKYQAVLPFFKLLVYSKTYQLPLSNELVETLKNGSGQRSDCVGSIFNTKNELQSTFKDLLQLEIFLRSRFLTAEKKEQLNKDLSKAVENVRDLSKSVNKQLSQIIYWTKF